ncbi:MAG: amino acid permease [Saprospiraceae bacterium]|nr:amino acid permease [Saprospiraceae bacterium]
MAKLEKRLNLWGLTMIAVGACIGSGIFASPGQIVQELPHHGLILIVWLLGGVIALTGALTFTELGSMYPKAGGVYVFLREAFGDYMGFLYGWVILLVINTGALAALAITFAEYMTFFVPMGQTAKVILAAITILGLTLINSTGVQTSQWLANVFTGAKLLALFVLIFIGLSFYDPGEIPLELTATAPDQATNGLMLGLIGVLWAMGGWHHASYMASETINARRTVPRAMVLGVIIVMTVYILTNLAYMMILPLDQIAGSDKVAGDAMAKLFPYGGQAIALVIAISVFGTIAIYTMSAPRIYYAMAEDKLFFESLKKIHPRFKTPTNAMWFQAIWAIVLLLGMGTFKKLITYVTFMDIIFMTLAGVAVFILRKKKPDLERPIRVPLFPIVPIIFIGISTAFVISTFFGKPEQAWAGLIVLGLGIPVYRWFRNRKAKQT